MALSKKDQRFIQEGAAKAAAMLRAIGNEHRMLVLCLLIEHGELTVGALLEHVALSQSALSQHLAVLRDEGLVATRREGQSIYYSVPAGPALEVLQVLHRVYCAAPAPV